MLGEFRGCINNSGYTLCPERMQILERYLGIEQRIIRIGPKAEVQDVSKL